MVFLPGEVVVDYAVRLKTELDWKKLWITAWTNKMPGYIPSRKVLMQGGYEADFSQVYYGLPGRYQPKIENLIVNTVRKLAGEKFVNPDEQKRFPFQKIPSNRESTFEKFRHHLKSLTSRERDTLLRCNRLNSLAITRNPVGVQVLANQTNPRRDHWFDLNGDKVDRAFIRQQSTKESIVINAQPIDWQSRYQPKPFFCIYWGDWAGSANQKREDLN